MNAFRTNVLSGKKVPTLDERESARRALYERIAERPAAKPLGSQTQGDALQPAAMDATNVRGHALGVLGSMDNQVALELVFLLFGAGVSDCASRWRPSRSTMTTMSRSMMLRWDPLIKLVGKKVQMSLAWKPKPLSSSRIEILAMYSGTVLVFSILSSLFGAPETWMASKGNLLNQLFAKYAWGWTSLLVWTLIALTLSAAPSTSTRPSASGNGPSSSATSTTIPAPSLLARLGVYARACLFWIVTTQWLFGASLTDRVLLSTGACDLDPVHLATLDVSVSASARASPRACKRSGGAWTGFDVSGHCLLLIHCAVLIQEEIERAKTVANAQSRSQVVWVVRVLRALQFLWWFMLIGTAMHFHSLPEAMAGTILTVCFWVVEFTYLS